MFFRNFTRKDTYDILVSIFSTRSRAVLARTLELSPYCGSQLRRLIKTDRHFRLHSVCQLSPERIHLRTGQQTIGILRNLGCRLRATQQGDPCYYKFARGTLDPQKYEFRFRHAAARINGNGLGRLNGWYTR